MTPSVRKSVRRLYPNHDESAVLSILTRFGKGITHARSAIVYDHMLHSAEGDLDRLAELVDWALLAPEPFQQYISRFESWLRASRRFVRQPPDYFQFVAPILRCAAPSLAEYRCSFIISHMTLCLHDSDQRFPCLIALYIVPLFDGGIFITDNDAFNDAPKTAEILQWCTGEIASGDRSCEAIIDHVARKFVHDCYPANVK